ncbi:hypothetical protein V2W30_39805 (plasmid) [Streptomyces sp. Q6]|uniref:Uncharacterized protein n=1 Tax=Streptomyces citrinus TaxID=3118173 RepID=A0ACD5AQ50_9ACTN
MVDRASCRVDCAPALRLLPVLLDVVLSTPAWLVWPFLPAERQKVVLEMVRELINWTYGTNRP